MKKTKAFTLIDVIVGTALVLIVFLGIFGAYQLGMKVVGQSKNKIIATAIANQEIEKIRNLNYESVGVKNSFPDGVLEASNKILRNNIEYKIERRVDYVIDSADGIAPPADDCPNDYKRAEIKVSWKGRFPGEVKLSTDIAPKNLVQECATGGGILSVLVFNAYGVMVSSPLIEIKNPSTDETLKTATPAEGKHYFSLAAGTYKVAVSKSGYSSERTYGTAEVAIPEKPHPIVLTGQLTENSFSIDRVSAFSVNTLSPWGTDSFSDSFLDESKISEKSNVLIENGEAKLARTDEEYLSSGYLISIAISPINLIRWDKLSFLDSEPENTDLKYQIYYLSGTDWLLIPDSDLPGNSTGFGLSPVDLAGLSTSTYSSLKLRANFSTTNSAFSPTLEDWQVSWITEEAIPIGNVTFNLRGEKLIGYDANENPVYKYSRNHTSNSQGRIDITGLEWDNYTFSVEPAAGLNLVGIDPEPQPIALAPDATQNVNLYLSSENSLLVTVQNIETLEPIFSATVRLYNLDYDNTQYTNEKGQTYFIPLTAATYNLEVQAAGYSGTSTQISVSGYTKKLIKLEQIE